MNINTPQPQNSTTKESNATSEIESTLKEGPKSTSPAHMLTCSSLPSLTVPVLLTVTIINNYAVT